MRKFNYKMPDLLPAETPDWVKKGNKIFAILNVSLGSLMLLALLVPIAFMYVPIRSGIYAAICQVCLFSMFASYLALLLIALALFIFLIKAKQRVYKSFGAICIVALTLFIGSPGLIPFVAIGGGTSMLLQGRKENQTRAKEVNNV